MIWQMNTPHIVKMFMWRACNNALATKANHFRLKIMEDPSCSLCGVEAETTGLALWSYPTTKAIWSMCGNKIQKRCIEQVDFVFILEELHRHLDQEDMELMAVVPKNLWFQRNAMVYGRPVSPHVTVVSKLVESLAAFQEANDRHSYKPIATFP